MEYRLLTRPEVETLTKLSRTPGLPRILNLQTNQIETAKISIADPDFQQGRALARIRNTRLHRQPTPCDRRTGTRQMNGVQPTGKSLADLETEFRVSYAEVQKLGRMTVELAWTAGRPD